MHEVVIRNGFVVDGTGAAGYHADVAINHGRITRIEKNAGIAHQNIEADGMLVAPGWVDIHTHFDAQATWDPELSPSGAHGVTTAVMGNCGVGFAPVAPDDRNKLVSIMEGVEGIPAESLSKAMKWDWQSFPEYLYALDKMPRTIDIGTHIPHSAVHAYISRQRSAEGAETKDVDPVALSQIVKEGLRAGALGFSTNRSPYHRDAQGVPIPGTDASFEQLLVIAKAIKEAGHGILEVAADPLRLEQEWDWLAELSIQGGIAVSCELVQVACKPDEWKKILSLTDQANSAGAQIWVQVSNRTIGSVMSWQSGHHPFVTRKSWRTISAKPWPEQLAALKDAGFRRQLLADPVERPKFESGYFADQLLSGWDSQFPVRMPPDYEPAWEASIAGIAAKETRTPAEVAYDVLMEGGGKGLLRLAHSNYAAGDLDAVREMLAHPATIISLSDAGAHATTCHDFSCPTFLLTHWARDRTRGSGRVPIETAIKWQTMDTAEMYRLQDRGQLKAGYLADINIIDLAALKLGLPYLAHDLPGGCARMLQGVSGYVATLKSGVVTYSGGKATGARPGRVIRGPQRLS